MPLVEDKNVHVSLVSPLCGVILVTLTGVLGSRSKYLICRGVVDGDTIIFGSYLLVPNRLNFTLSMLDAYGKIH